MTILLTGGAGFIGSNFVLDWLIHFNEPIINLDKLTYAGNLENLKDIEEAANYHFIKATILEPDTLKEIFEKHAISDVIHLAAESHVDRSIVSPLDFVYTNVIGTVNLLNMAKEYWKDDISYEKAHDGSWEKNRNHIFYHVSTDEVYGSLGKEGLFKETTAYDPNSPYSASKAASDHFVRAYGETYHLPYVVSN
jgi:dTDP-glucose 4,6-dehydratase